MFAYSLHVLYRYVNGINLRHQRDVLSGRTEHLALSFSLHRHLLLFVKSHSL